MAKARKAAKSRKAKSKSAAKPKRRKVTARKSKRKAKPRKAAKRKAPRRRRKQEGVAAKLAEGVEAIQESFEESAKMQERQGTRWGIGEG
jgi:hypothetical protein